MQDSVNILSVVIDKLTKGQVLARVEELISLQKQAYAVTINPEFIITAQKDQNFRQILNKADLRLADGIGILAAAKFIKLNSGNSAASVSSIGNSGRHISSRAVKFKGQPPLTLTHKGILPLGACLGFIPKILNPVWNLCTANFKKISRLSALCCSGLKVLFSIVFNQKYLNEVPEKITGSDLVNDLCQLANDNSYSVFFLGGRQGVAKKTALFFKKKYPSLVVAGTYEGDRSAKADLQTRNAIIKACAKNTKKIPSSNTHQGLEHKSRQKNILKSDPWQQLQQKTSSTYSHSKTNMIDILFVAYGHPYQEKWIVRNLAKLPVNFAIGVGGTFDFYAGLKKRAPKAFQKLGLEWLWRLAHEPKRIRRIINAAFIFPCQVFRQMI